MSLEKTSIIFKVGDSVRLNRECSLYQKKMFRAFGSKTFKVVGIDKGRTFLGNQLVKLDSAFNYVIGSSVNSKYLELVPKKLTRQLPDWW